MNVLSKLLGKQGQNTSTRQGAFRKVIGVIRPYLDQEGFHCSDGRIARRYLPGRVDVVSVNLFSPRDTRKWGIPETSFGLEAGSYLPFVPCLARPDVEIDREGRPQPKVTECQVRLTPYKGIKQSGNQHLNIWSIVGSPAEEAVVLEDAVRCLSAVIFPWFDRWGAVDALWDLFSSRDEFADETGRTWGFGNKGSYTRHVVAGFVANELGLGREARSHLLDALDCSKELSAKGLQMPKEVDDAVRRVLRQYGNSV